MKLKLNTPDAKWSSSHSPSITVRAKYEPYDALRQKFWREYLKSYDLDNTGKISLTELQTVGRLLGFFSPWWSWLLTHHSFP